MARHHTGAHDLPHPVIVRSSIPGKPEIWDWVEFLADEDLEGSYEYDLFDDSELPFRYRFVFSDLDTATMFRMRF